MAYLGQEPTPVPLSSADIGPDVINATHLAIGSVNLPTTDVTGILPVSKGGTGINTASGLLMGNGTNPITSVVLTGVLI